MINPPEKIYYIKHDIYSNRPVCVKCLEEFNRNNKNFMKLDLMDDDCDIEGNPLEDKWKYKSHQRYTITKIKNGLWEVAWEDGTTSTHSTQKGAEVMVGQLQSYGLVLSSIKHPRPPFLKRLLYYFTRTRFSSKAIEPVQDYLNNQIKKIEDNIR